MLLFGKLYLKICCLAWISRSDQFYKIFKLFLGNVVAVVVVIATIVKMT